MPVSETTYRQVALEDPSGSWELVCGELRRKPPMTAPHYEVSGALYMMLRQQLDRDVYQVRMDQSRVRQPRGNFFVPDVFVLRIDALGPDWRESRDLEVHTEPLPFVAEVWSRTTGDYDRTEKLDAYRERGDEEIWLIHPYERTVTAFHRQAPAEYGETVYRDGVAPIASLPGVRIVLAELFA